MIGQKKRESVVNIQYLLQAVQIQMLAPVHALVEGQTIALDTQRPVSRHGKVLVSVVVIISCHANAKKKIESKHKVETRKKGTSER